MSKHTGRMTETDFFKAWRAPKQEDKYYQPDKAKPIHPTTVGIYGASGTGKTNALMGIIIPTPPFDESQFENVVVCRGEDVEDWLYDMAEEKLGDNFSKIGLEELKEWVEHRRAQDRDTLPQTCLVLDDWMEDERVTKYIRKLPTYSRKINLTFVMIAQSYVDIPKLMRKQIKYNILMPGLASVDLQTMCRAMPRTSIDLAQLNDMYLQATQGGTITDWFMVDTSDSGKKNNVIFRKGFYRPFEHRAEFQPAPPHNKLAREEMLANLLAERKRLAAAAAHHSDSDSD